VKDLLSGGYIYTSCTHINHWLWDLILLAVNLNLQLDDTKEELEKRKEIKLVLS
jgi:hypothetical protein